MRPVEGLPRDRRRHRAPLSTAPPARTVTVQQFLAALGFLLCVALLVHHGLGARRQARLAVWWQVRVARLKGLWLQVRHGRRPRAPGEQERDQAEREAADLIERARRGADRSGNVIRPHRFGERTKNERPRRDLH